MRLLPAITFSFLLFFLTATTIVCAEDIKQVDALNPELTDNGYVEQDGIEVIDPVWQKSTFAKVYIYLAGYQGKITIDDVPYIPKEPSECAMIYVKTKNLAKRPAGQTYKTTLSNGKDGTLDVKVEVETFYQVKKYKTILGIRIPYYTTTSKTDYFYQNFDAPDVFPILNPPRATVTHYNGSHVILNVAYFDENGNKIDGIGKVDIKVPGSAAREYRLIGEIGTAENGFRSVDFHKVTTWKFSGKQISRSTSGIYIKEPFDINNLTITVSTPFEKNIPVTDIEYIVVEDTSRKFLNFSLFCLLVVSWAMARPIYLTVKREVAKCELEY